MAFEIPLTAAGAGRGGAGAEIGDQRLEPIAAGGEGLAAGVEGAVENVHDQGTAGCRAAAEVNRLTIRSHRW
jgi:hypothetical protein